MLFSQLTLFGVGFLLPTGASARSSIGMQTWGNAEAKARAMLNSMTLEEKAYIVTGATGPCIGNILPNSRLGFNGLCLQDGPSGIRIATYQSVFPAGISVAASWDRNLTYQRGRMIGREFRAKGSHIALGYDTSQNILYLSGGSQVHADRIRPVVGPLGRNPLDGRIWEGFGFDPYLAGALAGETVKGMQDAGTQACVKHFIGNEQETQRTSSTNEHGTTIEGVSSNIDDRTMHELYLWPFADAVRAGVSSVMCSYNRVNGTYVCQNDKLINGILKDELGFQGYTMSDWGAGMSGVESINAGLDMLMPGPIGISGDNIHGPSYFGGNLTKAVENGTVFESRIDEMILRVLTPYFHLGQDQNFPLVDPDAKGVLLDFVQGAVNPEQFIYYNIGGEAHRDVREDHGTLIRNLGAASSTLLKNTNGVLPLESAPRTVGIFGADAADLVEGSWGWENPVIGTLAGSSLGRLSFIISPLEAIKLWARSKGSLVQYITDNSKIKAGLPGIYPIPEVCFVFLSSFSGEGMDRTSFGWDNNGTEVIKTVAAKCNNTIVITHAVGVNLYDFADHPNITAIIAAHQPGEETGNSIVDVITGRVNPSGKLPFTIPYKAEDALSAPIANFTGAADSDAWQSNFTEGLLVDYRHYDELGITPRFEFGYGLSYTSFQIQHIKVTVRSKETPEFPGKSREKLPGGNSNLWSTVASVTIQVKNDGKVVGATVPQLYLSFPAENVPLNTPPQVLRGFEKITLEPGETRQINFDLTRKDVSFWDVFAQDWNVPAGEFQVRVGLSSRDIRQTGRLQLRYTVQK